jgi:plasmid stabilization system protein ParE
LTTLISRHPAIGRRTDLADVRVFAVRPYPYLIFYREEPGGITILRVRHMARKEDWRTGR